MAQLCVKQIFSFPLLLYHSHYGGIVLHYLCGQIFLIRTNINGESNTRLSHMKMKVILLNKRSCLLVVLLTMISSLPTTCTHPQTFALEELIKQCTSQILQASATNAHPIMFFFWKDKNHVLLFSHTTFATALLNQRVEELCKQANKQDTSTMSELGTYNHPVLL